MTEEVLPKPTSGRNARRVLFTFASHLMSATMSHSLPSAALHLVPGAIVASVGLFGSIILQVAGPIPLALEKLGETGFNPATRVRIFALCFNRAAVSTCF